MNNLPRNYNRRDELAGVRARVDLSRLGEGVAPRLPPHARIVGVAFLGPPSHRDRQGAELDRAPPDPRLRLLNLKLAPTRRVDDLLSTEGDWLTPVTEVAARYVFRHVGIRRAT